MKKKKVNEKEKTIYLVIITILAVLLLSSIYYIVYMNLDKIKEDKKLNNKINELVNEEVDENELEDDEDDVFVNYAKININHKNYAGGYRAEVKELFDKDNNEKYYVYMILRPDGTYTYGNNTIYGGRSVGTYKIESKYIVLTDAVSYGSDVCFTKVKKNNERKLKIIDKDTLEITEDGTKLRFKYNKNVLENEFENAWYILNPKDGESPKGFESDEEWDNCSD